MADVAISETQKAEVRAAIFNHLAGIVIAPTVKALADRKVFKVLSDASEVTLDEIVEHTRGNRGYLRVALRLLASCGWLKQITNDNGTKVTYLLTREGTMATSLAPPLYAEVLPFMPKAVFLEDFIFGDSNAPGLPSFPELVSRSAERWGMALPGDEVEARSVHKSAAISMVC